MSHLNIKVEARRATITLTRPELRNAFNDEVIAELTQAFTGLGSSDEVRAIVLAAEGPAFCAGADLNWMRRMADYDRAQNLADAARLAEMLRVIHQCPKPVIARVQGDVYAGGMGLVACSDIAISVDCAHYCLSETRLGLLPATISPYVMRAMGPRAAQRYCLSAERFDAAEALRLGVANKVVPLAELDAAVDALVGRILRGPRETYAEMKRLLNQSPDQSLDAQLQLEAEAFARCAARPDFDEGVGAFLEKRKPKFNG